MARGNGTGSRVSIVFAREVQMLAYLPAQPAQYDEFFELMAAESQEYLETTLTLMQMDRPHFRQLFQTVGEVYGIYSDEWLAGFYWIEVRESVLHLHALTLHPEYQGQGIGHAVFKWLEEQYHNRIHALELGVHRSNERALALYQKLGFTIIKSLDELGFYVMQKRLALESADGARLNSEES